MGHDEKYHIPESYLHYDFMIDKSEEWDIPFKIQVFVLHTRAQVAEVSEDEEAAAHSFTYRQTDSDGVGATILLSHEDLELSIMAHEATHIALFYQGNHIESHKRALTWLKNHPETVPQMVGNLTAMLWFEIQNIEEENAHE